MVVGGSLREGRVSPRAAAADKTLARSGTPALRLFRLTSNVLGRQREVVLRPLDHRGGGRCVLWISGGGLLPCPQEHPQRLVELC
jgi:hypothetical protein